MPKPTSEPEPVQKYTRKKAFFGVVVLAFVMILMFFELTPEFLFAKFETCFYLLLISSPIGLLLYSRQKESLHKRFSPFTRFDIPICFACGYALISLGLILFINTQGSSLSQTETFPIIGKHYEQGKSSKRFYVEINMPSFVDTPFSMTDTQTIQVSQLEYEHITTGTSITLTYQMGSLGMPWYLDYSLNGLSEKRIQMTTRSSNDLAIIAACEWKEKFDVTQEIERLAPDGYIRDFWDNGKPRSVEPTVNGLRHGIAHYTFANDVVYGDIPWKQGQKHGVFTLYREDGTVDQILSYKNGEPYGIQQWFNPDGTLSYSSVYYDGGRSRNIELCTELGTL